MTTKVDQFFEGARVLLGQYLQAEDVRARFEAYRAWSELWPWRWVPAGPGALIHLRPLLFDRMGLRFRRLFVPRWKGEFRRAMEVQLPGVLMGTWAVSGLPPLPEIQAAALGWDEAMDVLDQTEHPRALEATEGTMAIMPALARHGRPQPDYDESDVPAQLLEVSHAD